MLFFKNITLIQTIYFLLTGLWPIIDIESFMQVTGPKTDIWLVKTVGILIIVISLPLAVAHFKRRITSEVVVLGMGSSLSLAAIDIIYVTSDTIPPVYLLDALTELVLAVFWLIIVLKIKRQTIKY